MRIGIATPYLVPNADAIGIDVLAMRDVLATLGHDVLLFTEAAQADVQGGTQEIGNAGKFLAAADDLMLFHHSTGWCRGMRELACLRCRRVVRFHNVTPPSFFDGVDEAYRVASEEGIAQTRALAALPCELFMCDSAFNRDELLNAGLAANRCVVVPPFNQLERLYAHKADDLFAEHLRDGCCTVLNVGRLAPNKDHATLISAFCEFVRHTEAHSRLLVIGHAQPGLMAYRESLVEQARSLGCADRIEFSGLLSEESLKAAYAIADLFVIASRHEGFCVPVVEAMAAKIPIVACRTAALPETVDDCGLLTEPGDVGAMLAPCTAWRLTARLRRSLRSKGCGVPANSSLRER